MITDVTNQSVQFRHSRTHLVRTLADMYFGSGIQFVVIAIRSSDGTVLREPQPGYTFRPDDTMIVLAHRSTELRLQGILKSKEITYRGARI